ncbi:3-deoxy-D-manno-octulosonic acid transferase [Bergeyella sp. RCAD1439]|uniref:3-deoxy-D-manno-octulosonic acid transferase n=1 Tax=Bergeyella anatis TaxID=3113737 RepID=UPI002E16FB38|nr:glycosyltransferase N-terminal domain-containing protein [Bergeyella sp. RCAD1439]
MAFLYRIFVFLMRLGMRIGSVFNLKLRKGVQGREWNEAVLRKVFSSEDRVIWMHAASLGEYEQGLPVLEKLKAGYPTYKILVTFFSPSGYDPVIKKNTIADAVCYLPFDDKKSVGRFLACFKPVIFFTVKYDYWYRLFEELKKREVKIYVVSALFYEKQMFFKPYGHWFVQRLMRDVDWFFHQTSQSLSLARTLGLSLGSISGDTRYDRVRQIASKAEAIEGIDDYRRECKLVVFGSSWQAEEEVALAVAKKHGVKIILAPHDLKRVEHLRRMFPEALCYSQMSRWTALQKKEAKVLIIDSIGLLSRLYRYADLAVVGGGFHSAGLHNILEAAAFGVPVLFGSHYRKNPEADALIESGGAKAFSETDELSAFASVLLGDTARLEAMAKASFDFVEGQPVSSDRIFEKIRLQNND